MYLSLLADGLDEAGSPGVSALVRALTADLRFTSEMLGSLDAIPRAAGSSEADERLARQAGRWAAAAARLVRDMEGALGDPGVKR